MVTQRKRQRKPEDSDEETSNEPTYRAIDIVFADAHQGRPTSTKDLTAVMGQRWNESSRFINSILGSGFGLRVKNIPEVDRGTKGGNKRNEVYLKSTLPAESQKVVNKYINRRNTRLQSLQKFVVLFVIASDDSMTEERLAKRLVDARLFSTRESAVACIHQMQTMRLLEAKKNNTQNTATATKSYSVGPLAASLYDQESLAAEFKDLFGYSSDTQPSDIVKRNDERIKQMITDTFT